MKYLLALWVLVLAIVTRLFGREAEDRLPDLIDRLIAVAAWCAMGRRRAELRDEWQADRKGDDELRARPITALVWAFGLFAVAPRHRLQSVLDRARSLLDRREGDPAYVGRASTVELIAQAPVHPSGALHWAAGADADEIKLPGERAFFRRLGAVQVLVATSYGMLAQWAVGSWAISSNPVLEKAFCLSVAGLLTVAMILGGRWLSIAAIHRRARSGPLAVLVALSLGAGMLVGQAVALRSEPSTVSAVPVQPLRHASASDRAGHVTGEVLLIVATTALGLGAPALFLTMLPRTMHARLARHRAMGRA